MINRAAIVRRETLFCWKQAYAHILRTHAELDRRINERAALYARIAECAVNGEVWIVETGMDCDCVQYTNRPYQIDATPKAYFTEYGRIAEWADGPFALHIIEPWQVSAVRRMGLSRCTSSSRGR